MPVLRQKREKLLIHGFNRVKSQKVTTEKSRKKKSANRRIESDAIRCILREEITHKRINVRHLFCYNLACL